MKIPVLGGHCPGLAAILMLPLLGDAGMLASGCSRAPPSINLRFALDDAGRNNRDGSAEVVVRNLQFYVHDVALRGADGRWRELKLANAGRWQSDRVALIDLAGSAGAERSAALHGALAEGGSQRYSAVRFTLGVPFDLNHANPLTAAAPLDRGELFWSWQLGYKFLRADLADGEREWSFHLGSTGCVSASSVRPPSAPCAQPNRIRVQIDDIDPLQAPIRLRLDELVTAMRTVGHAICTGDYARAEGCAEIFTRTGLSVETGTCPEDVCRTQRLFSAKRVAGS
jgi:uncharacterized repeat protein (TIGR04052 family)